MREQGVYFNDGQGQDRIQGIPSRLIPKGIAPLSSKWEEAAIITMTSSGGIPARNQSFANLSADNQASLVINLRSVAKANC
jgi:hypothetical protein